MKNTWHVSSDNAFIEKICTAINSYYRFIILINSAIYLYCTCTKCICAGIYMYVHEHAQLMKQSKLVHVQTRLLGACSQSLHRLTEHTDIMYKCACTCTVGTVGTLLCRHTPVKEDLPETGWRHTCTCIQATVGKFDYIE